MKKNLIALIAAAAVLCAGAAETLSLKFNEAQKVTISNREYAVEGNFQDGALAIGQKGLSIPGGTLIGKNQGTLALNFKIQADDDEKVQRSLMHLRTASRLTLGFNSYRGGNFQFFFSDNTNHKFYFDMKKALAPGQVHWAVLTWDGTNVKCYFDGKLVAEKPQPMPVEVQVRNLNFGPYKDGWMAPKMWKSEVLLLNAKVFNIAATAEEIAAFSK